MVAFEPDRRLLLCMFGILFVLFHFYHRARRTASSAKSVRLVVAFAEGRSTLRCNRRVSDVLVTVAYSRP